METATGGETLDEVLQRSLGGDAAACTELYRRLGRPLYGTALRMLGRPEDAEDAMQETFLTLYCKTPDLLAAQLGAWLHRVLVNHCIDRIRRRTRWQEQEWTEVTTGSPAPPNGVRIDLERAVERLPKRAKLIFVLHDVEGFKHKEVAEMLGLKEGTTKSQLFRAREMLRGFMKRAPRGSR